MKSRCKHTSLFIVVCVQFAWKNRIALLCIKYLFIYFLNLPDGISLLNQYVFFDICLMETIIKNFCSDVIFKEVQGGNLTSALTF